MATVLLLLVCGACLGFGLGYRLFGVGRPSETDYEARLKLLDQARWQQRKADLQTRRRHML